MTNEITLELLAVQARGLAAQHLRSSAVAVARLRELIEEAHRLGHSHCAIHGALVSGGLDIGWNNYRVALARARKAGRTFDAEHRSLDSQPLPLPLPPPSPAPRQRPSPLSTVGLTADSCATPVLDALRRARDTSSRDYARVALDSHRKEPRP
jgi:hypothetical protein